jgi:hypothetical protein
MARARFTKPEFYKHGDLFDAEKASGLPLRLAFAGLWTQCDRAGRFVWKPRELKLDVLPYDDVDFADVLDALERHGFLKSYVVDGKRYGVIPSLVDHQPFHKNEPASKLPEPPIQTPTTPTNGESEPAFGRLKPTKDRPRRSTTVTTTDTVTTTEKERAPAVAASKHSATPNGRHPPTKPDIAPPDTPALAPPPPRGGGGGWTARLARIFAERGVTESPGKIGKMLEEAHGKFTDDQLADALAYFLDKGVSVFDVDPQFLTLNTFAKNPRHWVEQVSPIGSAVA